MSACLTQTSLSVLETELSVIDFDALQTFILVLGYDSKLRPTGGPGVNVVGLVVAE